LRGNYARRVFPDEIGLWGNSDDCYRFTPNVRFGSKADMCNAQVDVRSYPKSGHVRRNTHVRFVPIADIGARARESCDAARMISLTDNPLAIATDSVGATRVTQ
jgi:hypothetical protein